MRGDAHTQRRLRQGRSQLRAGVVSQWGRHVIRAGVAIFEPNESAQMHPGILLVLVAFYVHLFVIGEFFNIFFAAILELCVCFDIEAGQSLSHRGL